MPKLSDCIRSKQGRELWAALYKYFMHKDLPKDEDEREIHLEGQIEPLEEIKEIMEQPGRGAWHE